MTENLELREWIAVNVMGFRKAHDGAWIMPRTVDVDGAETAGAQWTLPPYELTWNDAALVVEAMRARGYRFSLLCWDNDDAEGFCVEFQRWSSPPGGASKGPDSYGEAESPTAPTAICLAARAAIEGEG